MGDPPAQPDPTCTARVAHRACASVCIQSSEGRGGGEKISVRVRTVSMMRDQVPYKYIYTGIYIIIPIQYGTATGTHVL